MTKHARIEDGLVVELAEFAENPAKLFVQKLLWIPIDIDDVHIGSALRDAQFFEPSPAALDKLISPSCEQLQMAIAGLQEQIVGLPVLPENAQEG